MNHKNLVNDVIKTLSSKSLAVEPIEEFDESPSLKIRLKMDPDNPLKIPYENVDWIAMSTPENIAQMEKAMDTMWEYEKNLMQLPHDVAKNNPQFEKAVRHVIDDVGKYISQNFTIDLDYDHYKEYKDISLVEEAMWYVDDGIRIMEAIIKGCEDYQLNIEFYMMQQQSMMMQNLTNPNIDVSDKGLSEKILMSRFASMQDSSLSQTLNIGDILEKLSNWIKKNLTEKEIMYAMEHDFDNADEEMTRINDKMLSLGFGKFMHDLLYPDSIVEPSQFMADNDNAEPVISEESDQYIKAMKELEDEFDKAAEESSDNDTAAATEETE